MEIDNIVTRYKYEHDIVFRIIHIEGDICFLEGVFVRLLADAPIDDLKIVEEDFYRNKEEEDKHYQNEIARKIKKNNRYLYGKILHIDGDLKYLEKSQNLYNKIGIYAKCIHIKEAELEYSILDIIDENCPDIVVITGHDSYNNRGVKDLNNYVNSKYFFNACRKIRSKYGKDHIFLIAGACQSNFEAMIASGCNYAMSKKRVNIHALDPAIVAIKAATTPFDKIVYPKDIFNYTVSKDKGIGGVESYGKMRLLF